VLASFSKQKITAKNKHNFDNLKKSNLTDIVTQSETSFVLDVYLYCKDKLTSDAFLQPGNPQKKDGRMGIVPVLLHPSTVQAISTIQLNLPHNHRDADNGKTVELMYMELLKRFDQGNSLKELDPISDMEIEFDEETDDLNIAELVEAREKIQTELTKPQFGGISKAQVENYNTKQALKKEIEDLESEIKKTSKMIMSTDLINMKRVMRRLDMIDKNDVPHLKGKVAAGLSAADELLTTELIFSGFFQDLTPIQIAAVMSCLVYNDTKSEGKPPKEEELSGPF
jgi:ATP-dependent RNA helicase DOB1